MYHATTHTHESTKTGQLFYGWTIHQDNEHLASIHFDFTTADQRDASMMRHLHMWAKAGAVVTVDKMLVQLG